MSRSHRTICMLTSFTHGAALAAIALASATACQAQAVQTAAPAAPAASAANRHTRVLEDDNVRIEETHQRGQVQRIRVRSKLPGVRDYEINPSPGGKDLSQNPGTVGKRSWSILDF
jgi:hypothetical protein